MENDNRTVSPKHYFAPAKDTLRLREKNSKQLHYGTLLNHLAGIRVLAESSNCRKLTYPIKLGDPRRGNSMKGSLSFWEEWGSHCRWTSLFMQKLLFKIAAGTWFRKGGKSPSWFPDPSLSLLYRHCHWGPWQNPLRGSQTMEGKEGKREWKSEWDGNGLPGGINAM